MRTFARSAELSSVYSGWSTSCSRASVRYMRPPRLAEAFVLPGLSRSGRVPGVPTTGATCLLQPGVRGGGEAGVPRCEEPRDAPQPRDGEGRNRTGDTTIFSRVLYQLSYLAARADGSGR